MPSGAVPVLAAVGFWEKDPLFSADSSDIYAAKLAAPTLIRYYIHTLGRLGLVQAVKLGKRRTFRLTVEGLRAVARYEREMRQGCTDFGRERLMRVLTNPLPW
jgi:hypothetical protein